MTLDRLTQITSVGITSGITLNNATLTGVTTIASLDSVSVGGTITAVNGTFSGNVSIAGTLTYEDVTNIDSVGLITARSGIHVTGGSVGIGTDNPQHDIHLYRNGDATLFIQADADNVDETHNPKISLSQDGLTSSIFDVGINGTAGDAFTDALANTAYLYSVSNASSNGIQFATNGAARMYLNSSGNLGIGTDNPIMRLHVHGAANSADSRIRLSSIEGSGLTIRAQSATENNINADSGEDITFSRGNVESLRITSSGKIGIGTGNPLHLLHLWSNGSAGILIQADADNIDETHNASIAFAQDGSNTEQFKIGLEGSAGTEFTDSVANAAYIHANNAASQPLQFAHNGAHVMTLQSGNVGIATNNPATLLDVRDTIIQSDNVGLVRILNDTVSTGSASNTSLIVQNNNVRCQFFAWEASGIRMGVRNKLNTGSGNVYITAGNDTIRLTIDAATGNFTGSASADISDGRLKENIQDISATDAVNIIKGLQGRTFTWKEEANMGTDIKYGFIAQEVESILPNLVHQNSGINRVSKDVDKQDYGQGEIVDDYSDAYKDDTQSEWSKSVEKTGIIPILVEALKDSIAKIETLESEVAALKAAQ